MSIATLYFAVPSLQPEFVHENRFLENLTAALYLSAALSGLVLLLDSCRARVLLTVVIAFGLLGFLDETSYGADLRLYQVSRVGGVRIDALHDFVELGIRTLHARGAGVSPGDLRSLLLAGFAGAGVGIGAFIYLGYLSRFLTWLGSRRARG
ncbi:MAG: hypothetical protein ACREQY_02975, partial [Candidatus Binatia bacterium]